MTRCTTYHGIVKPETAKAIGFFVSRQTVKLADACKLASWNGIGEHGNADKWRGKLFPMCTVVSLALSIA